MYAAMSPRTTYGQAWHCIVAVGLVLCVAGCVPDKSAQARGEHADPMAQDGGHLHHAPDTKQGVLDLDVATAHDTPRQDVNEAGELDSGATTDARADTTLTDVSAVEDTGSLLDTAAGAPAGLDANDGGSTPLAGKEDIAFSDLKKCTQIPSQMPMHFIDCGEGEVGLKAYLDESYASGFTCEIVCCAFWYSGCIGRAAQANLNYCALKDNTSHSPCDEEWSAGWSSSCLCEL